MTQAFSATIYKLGINPCVDVPKRVSQTFGKRGYVPVRGMLNRQPIRATLVPKGEGRHRLFINGDMRKRAAVDVGNRVKLTLRVDGQPRIVAMPQKFAHALRSNRAAKVAFEQLQPSIRKQILTYLGWLKSPEALQRNIEKTIAMLLRRN